MSKNESVTLSAEQFDALVARTAAPAAAVQLQIPSESTLDAYRRKLRERGIDPQENVPPRTVTLACVSSETGRRFDAVIVASRSDERGRVVQIINYGKGLVDEYGQRTPAGLKDIMDRVAQYEGTDRDLGGGSGATKRSAFTNHVVVPLTDPAMDKSALCKDFNRQMWREVYHADLKRYNGQPVSKCGLLLETGDRPPVFPVDLAAE